MRFHPAPALIALALGCGSVATDDVDETSDAPADDSSGDVAADADADVAADADADVAADADADVAADADADAADAPADDAPPPRCGDGHADPGEECDDGNTAPGDGCESDCRYSCHDVTECDDRAPCTVDRCADNALGRACDHGPAIGASCNDGDPCTTDDRCEEGACVGGGCAPACRWYPDEDDDDHGDASAEPACGVEPPSDGRYAPTGDDCCDANDQVFPGQERWFTAAYAECGARSWDYDCSGEAERRWPDCITCTDTGSSCLPHEGWLWSGGTGTPSCDPPDCGLCFYLINSCIREPAPTEPVCVPNPVSSRSACQECR